ncbi:MAG: SMI1/KNR4 family protein [Deltaproteobacteria bacterium]|nr:SMI1/KNR4 family protein [Deltaproteobacteria bacterium]
MHRVIALTRAGGKIIPRSDGMLVIQHDRIAFAVDPRSGAVAPTPLVTPEPPRAGDPEVALGRAGLRLDERETDGGPASRILSREGAELAVFAGITQRLGIAGHLFGGVVAFADETRAIVAGVLGDRDRHVLRISEDGRTAAAGKDFVAVAGAPGSLHVFRTIGGALSRVTVGLPAMPVASILVEGDVVWLVIDDKLLAVDVAILPRETRGTHATTFTPVVPPAAPVTEPGTVAFAIATSIGIDHPRLGRIVIARGPEHPDVSRGDAVVLEDVYEELPGIFRARAFRTAEGKASARPPPIALEAKAPAVDEQLVRWDETAVPSSGMQAGLLAQLEDLSERHHFRIPPLLARLLEAADGDAVVHRWLARLGFEVEVAPKCPDWGADPFCLGFASEGNGDAYCLYPYPPLGDGEPPIVEFLHETNECELLAPTFDAFFSDFLARRLEWKEPGHAEIVALIVARLGLPPPERIAAPPRPDWLPENTDDDDLVAKAEAFVNENELVLAERFLVARWLAEAAGRPEYTGLSRPASGVREQLLALYERLGWTLPLESLRDYVE